MKTLISFLLVAFMANLSKANDNFKLSIQGHTLILNTALWSTDDVTVKIVDYDGHILVQKKYAPSASTSPLKKFNLAQLNAGEYQVVLSNDQKISKQSFLVKPSEVTLLAGLETFIKPHVALNGTNLKVNYLNFDNKSTIKILDRNNETVYEALINIPVYTKQFDLALMNKGDFTLLVTQGDETFVQTLTLK